jgi:hypothetical protein
MLWVSKRLILILKSKADRTQNISYILLLELLVEASKSIKINNSYVQYEEYPGSSEQCKIFNEFYTDNKLFI